MGESGKGEEVGVNEKRDGRVKSAVAEPCWFEIR